MENEIKDVYVNQVELLELNQQMSRNSSKEREMELRVSDIKECSERDILAELNENESNHQLYHNHFEQITPMDNNLSVGDAETEKKISAIHRDISRTRNSRVQGSGVKSL